MRFCMSLVILLLTAYQGPPPHEAYPGQRSHDEPPKNWFCRSASAPGVDKDHACSCKRMAKPMKEDPDCCDVATAPEDPQCNILIYNNNSEET